ncbi:MAG TPA: hypothetical protein PK778_04740 [Bacillota bacterium]|nr:hypothetical protein [Clostridiales bacterium]HPT85281.1 hypothetical protein [Bacillota bacterium]
MIKYLLKCALHFAICAAIAAGAAAAFGIEYRIIAGEDEKVVSYEKISDSQGRLTVGNYAFTLDLDLIEGAKDKLSDYLSHAVSYLPELALKTGKGICDLVSRFGD